MLNEKNTNRKTIFTIVKSGIRERGFPGAVYDWVQNNQTQNEMRNGHKTWDAQIEHIDQLVYRNNQEYILMKQWSK